MEPILPPASISLPLQKFQPQRGKFYSLGEYLHVGARCIFVHCLETLAALQTLV